MNTAPTAVGPATAPTAPSDNPFAGATFAPEETQRFRAILDLARGGYARRDAFTPAADLRNAADMARAGARLIIEAMKKADAHGVFGAVDLLDDHAAQIEEIAAECAALFYDSIPAVEAAARVSDRP